MPIDVSTVGGVKAPYFSWWRMSRKKHGFVRDTRRGTVCRSAVGPLLARLAVARRTPSAERPREAEAEAEARGEGTGQADSRHTRQPTAPKRSRTTQKGALAIIAHIALCALAL